MDLDFLNPEERCSLIKHLDSRFYVKLDHLSHLRLIVWAFLKGRSKSERAEHVIECALQQVFETVIETDLTTFNKISGLDRDAILQQAVVKQLAGSKEFDSWVLDPQTNLYVRRI